MLEKLQDHHFKFDRFRKVVDDLMEKLTSIVQLIKGQPLIQVGTSENPKVPLDIL